MGRSLICFAWAVISFFLLAISVAQINQDVEVNRNREEYNLEAFTSYNTFKRELERYSLGKTKQAFDFFLSLSQEDTSAFLSFIDFEKSTLLQLFYALHRKDLVYANLLTELSPKFNNSNPEELKNWLETNINFNRSEIYNVVENMVNGNHSGLQIPKYLSDQILLLNKKYNIFETACLNGNVNITKWFIEAGLDLKTVSSILLENSSVRHHKKIIELFLNYNVLNQLHLSLVDLNKIIENETLLHIAAELGQAESLIILTNAGADINVLDSMGRTPLTRAVLSNQWKIFKFLADIGANVSVISQDTGNSLLHLATINNSTDGVGKLLELGAPVNQKNYKGESALHLAAENENVQIIYLLVFAGGDINYETNTGDTLMHIACNRGNIDIVKTLINLKGNVNKRNRLEEPPIYFSANRGDISIVNLLIENGEDLSSKDRKGMTLLHKAAKTGNIKAASTLLKSGLNIDVRGFQGTTPLYSSVDEGYSFMVKFFLENKADPNIISDGGWSPLHRAALWGFEDIAVLLIEYGANPNITTTSGWTPFTLAQEYGHKKLIDIIKSVLDPHLADIVDIRASLTKSVIDY